MALVLFDIDDTLLDDAGATLRAVSALHRRLGGAEPLTSFIERWRDASQRHYASYLRRELSFEAQRRARGPVSGLDRGRARDGGRARRFALTPGDGASARAAGSRPTPFAGLLSKTGILAISGHPAHTDE
jgi:hypothetical protein